MPDPSAAEFFAAEVENDFSAACERGDQAYIYNGLMSRIAMLPANQELHYKQRMETAFGKLFHRQDWASALKALRKGPRPVQPSDTANPMDGLILSQEGSPRALLANAIIMLRHHPDWQNVLAFDEFHHRTAALKPPPWRTAPVVEWTDHEDTLTADWLQHHGVLVNADTAAQAAQAVAQGHSFHPVRDYLDSLKWDRTGRIDTWLSLHLGVAHSEYVAAVGACWLISAVARIYRAGCKADCCLILEGLTGKKKSMALESLAGQWFTDEVAELGSKDSAMQTQGVWIIEISELDGMTRSEVGRIKAFMSRTTDRFRPPYGRRVITAPRQCVFAGSSNMNTYLRDETGNRRFWPIACQRIDIPTLRRDRDQLWAEARERFRAGSIWWLEDAKLVAAAADEQSSRFEEDAWQVKIEAYADGLKNVSIQEILTNCFSKPAKDWTQLDRNRIARCLRAMGWERYNARATGTTGGREWRYAPPLSG